MSLIAALGYIIQVGLNQLITDDLETPRRIAAVRSTYCRSIWYDGMRLEADHNHLLSKRVETRHNALRAKMAAGVS